MSWFVPDWFYGKKKKVAYEESAWLMQGQTKSSKTKTKTKTIKNRKNKKERQISKFYKLYSLYSIELEFMRGMPM